MTRFLMLVRTSMNARTALIVFAVLMLCSTTILASDPLFDPLVRSAHERLLVAELVAHYKYVFGTPVEDLEREHEVLRNAGRQSVALDLSMVDAEKFFADQIEANKWIQYALLTEWRVNGNAPQETPVDLATEVRPRLDRLQDELLRALHAVRPFREDPACQKRLDTAVIVHAENEALDSMRRAALIRGLVSVCNGKETS